jgi:pseudouridine synthase
MAESIRLQRYLAAAGVAARRKAEELITAGRVTVNGAVITVLGTRIDPEHDAVEVDGEAVVALDWFYVLFNKPKGCITAVTDDRGRPTVMDYLPNLPVPVKPVGRLDFYSVGVLLLTNDGELAARLLAPASHVPKTYHVKVHGRLERADLAALRSGVTLEDGTTTLPAEVEILPGESKHTWLGITIHEGKHRQIHRMIEALGHRVDKLQRVAFANLTFHELRVGDARELTQQELNELRDSVGLDHSAVARGRWQSRREETDLPRRARARDRAEQEAAASGASPNQAHQTGGQADQTGGQAHQTEGQAHQTEGQAHQTEGQSHLTEGQVHLIGGQAHLTPGRGPAVSRGAADAPRRRAADAGRTPRAPAEGRTGGTQRFVHGEGRDERSGRGHGKAASERGAGDRQVAYGKPASERGAGDRRAAYGKAASERGAGDRRAAYGNRASERGAGDRRAAYGKPASERGAGGRRAAFAKAPDDRGPRATSGAKGSGSRRSAGHGFGPRAPRRGRPPK